VQMEMLVKGAQDWTALLAFAGVLLTGAVQVHRRVIRPVSQILNTVLLMGQQFKPNGGTTMFDRMGRIEGQLVRNATVAKVLLQESQDAVFETDEHGDCVWVNDAYTHLTGLSTDQAAGRGWWAAIAIKDKVSVAREWDEAVERRVPFTGHYHWTDGVHEFPVRCRVKLAIANDGKFYGAIGVVRKVEGDHAA